VVSAPAGFGKTTLLSAWIALDPMPIAWLSLEEDDNDPVRFLRYLIAALQAVDARIGTSALAALQSAQAASSEGVLPGLLNELADVAGDFALVLDDYHLITSGSIHTALTFLLDRLPPQMHVVIATRSDPPLPLPRLRARGQLIEIRSADLRFTLAEAMVFFQETMALALAADDVEALVERTEGWIAALQLATLALQAQEDSRTFIAEVTGSHRYIAEYLLEEVLRHLPDRAQTFLLQTAILDRLTGALCDSLTLEQDGEDMLAYLERTNLFVVPLDTQQRWYRYHRLFADLLRQQLQQQGAERVRALHRRAAEWYEQQAHGVPTDTVGAASVDHGSSWNVGMATEAVDHALAAQDWERAAHIIEGIADLLLWQRAELTTLVHWLAALPDEISRSRPRLNLIQAWALLWSRQVDAVETHLRAAEDPLADDYPREEGSSAGSTAGASARAIIGEAAVIGAELARMRGDLPRSFALAHRALAALPAHDGALRGIATAVQADAYVANGEVTAAATAYEEASGLLEGAGRLVPALIARGHLVQLHAMQGQLHQAAESYLLTRQVAATHGMERWPVMAVAMVRMGDVLREWNDLEAAREHLVEGLKLGQQWEAMAEHLVAGSISLARVHQALGDLPGAHGVLEDQIGRLAGEGDQRRRQVEAYRPRLWLAEGKVARAAQWAAQARLDPHDEPAFQRETEQVTLARILLAQGRWEAALSVLGRLGRAAETAGRLCTVIETLVLQALAFEGQNDSAEASSALEQALVRAEPGGYIRIFLDEGEPVACLLRRIEPRRIAAQYVETLLDAFDAGETGDQSDGTMVVRGRTSPARDQVLVEPLSEREIEVLRLIAAGKSNREIARELIVTLGTVKKHINNIFGKLAVHSRTQAVARARELHLVP
jgi:LuxR family maltose regulon positive regulatory protein